MANILIIKSPNFFRAGSNEEEIVGERTRHCRKFRLSDALDGRKRYRIAYSIHPIKWVWFFDLLGCMRRFWHRMYMRKAIHEVIDREDWL